MAIKVSTSPRITDRFLADWQARRRSQGYDHEKYNGDDHIVRMIADTRDKSSSRAYGIELELPAYGYLDSLPELNKLPIGRKRDGSIGDGIEFIFPPLTRSQIKANGLYEKFFNLYAMPSGYDNGTHGMHIHVPGTTVEGTAVIAINTLARLDPSLFRWFAGRRGYDPYNDEYNNSRANRAGFAFYQGLSAVDDRALIGFNSVGTVEFRIFNAAKDKESIDASVEFVSAVVAFARTKKIRKLVTGVMLECADALGFGTDNTPAYRQSQRDVLEAQLMDEPLVTEWYTPHSSTNLFGNRVRMFGRTQYQFRYAVQHTLFGAYGYPRIASTPQATAVVKAFERTAELPSLFRKFIKANAGRWPTVNYGLTFYEEQLGNSLPSNPVAQGMYYDGDKSYRTQAKLFYALSEEMKNAIDESSADAPARAVA